MHIIKTDESCLDSMLKEQLELIDREIENLKKQKGNLVSRLKNKTAQENGITEFPVDEFTFENSDIVSTTYSTTMEQMGEAIGNQAC